MVYPFIAAIPRQGSQNDNWDEWLLQTFEASNLFLEKYGQLLYKDNLMGFFQLMEMEEAQPLFQSASWFPLIKEKCPWLNEVAGFFNWTHVVDQNIAQEQLLPKLVELGCPVIARTDNYHFKQPVRLTEFYLTNLLSKYGFDDGDALLSRDKNYLAYVYNEITQCLEKAGLEGHVVMLETAHNPLRLSEDLLQNGEKVSDETLTLAALAIKVWAYDWSLVSDATFWLD